MNTEIRQLPYPQVEPMEGNRYRVAKPYTYEWEHEGETYRITVPTGFVNNLASVPRILWFYISPFDLGRAAIVHDWLYAKRGALPGDSFQRATREAGWVRVDEQWSRHDADRLFARMMRESGVSRAKRRRAYWAVRIFGGGAW